MSAYPRNCGAAVDVAAGYRASAASMCVIDERQCQTRLVAAGRVIAGRAFHDVPAVIEATLVRANDVDLFVQILADVRDVKEIRCRVEGVPPGISQSFRPDLAAMIGLIDEGIISGNSVGIAVV